MMDEEEFKAALVEKLMPAIIDYLFEFGHLPIDENVTIDDVSYTVLSEGLIDEIIDSIGCRLSIYDELMECIRASLEQNWNYSAILLAGTCIEHIVNEFYIYFMNRKFYVDVTAINSALKSLSLKDKCTWFLKITADLEMSQKILSDILAIYTLRSKIIHYKSYPLSFDDMDNHFTLSDKHDRLIANILPTISELEKFFDLSLLELFPAKRKACEVLSQSKS